MNFWNASEFCVNVFGNCNNKNTILNLKKIKNALIDCGCKTLPVESPNRNVTKIDNVPENHKTKKEKYSQSKSNGLKIMMLHEENQIRSNCFMYAFKAYMLISTGTFLYWIPVSNTTVL